MALLIDGYNLLHATGIVGRGRGPGSLERSRNALLNFVAATVDDAELPNTTVVFDAKDAPPGLQRTVVHRGITVQFAAGFDEADDLLEELIRTEPTPRKLLVVSSDHRVQRAARRRRASIVNSDVWYDEAIRRRRETQGLTARDTKPDEPGSRAEVDRWMAEFGIESLPAATVISEDTTPVAGESTASIAASDSPSLDDDDGGTGTSRVDDQTDASCRSTASELRANRELPDDVENPFPPGYADDLFDSRNS